MHFDTLQDWLRWQEKLHPKEIDLGLARVKSVYGALAGRRDKPLTVTVGGTNGKGSTIAFLEAILRQAGWRVGTYTSPHLVRYNERIRIDGEPVADPVICEAFERIDAVRRETSLSYFEFGTLAALDIFSRSGLDVQLLEVGLGGRLDAVNIVDPDVAVITSICIDHVDWLGETREAIGREKAGIFREGVPAVIGDPDPPVSLLQCADSGGVPVFRIGHEFSWERHGEFWTWRGADGTLKDLPVPALQGEHQFMNASAVLQALQCIRARRPVSEEAIRRGLTSVRLSGRFQLIPGPVDVLLDVAHNPQAARTLAAYLRQMFAHRRIRAVFSIMRDKDVDGVLNCMRNVVSEWYLSPLAIDRSMPESMLLDAFVRTGVDCVTAGFADFAEAFSAAQRGAGANDLIVIFGSFFLVSEFLKREG